MPHTLRKMRVSGTCNDYQKDKQFQKINSEKDIIDVAVVRGGKQLVVPNVDILVGDVVLLSTGDKVSSSPWLLLCDGHKCVIQQALEDW